MTISAKIIADSVSPQGIRLTTLQLRERISYDPLTGIFTWLPSNHPGWSHSLEGKIAGRITSKGYVQITLYGRTYVAHVLAWLWMTGEWPNIQVDHRNLNRQDNRWDNLRLATNGQNRSNSRTVRAMKGVYKNVGGSRYYAAIRHDKVLHRLGSFATAAEAKVAYDAAAVKFHGEFARLA